MIHELPRTFVLTVKKTWQRWEATRDHLKERGIDAEPFIGIDREVCKLDPVLTFDVNKPGEKLGRGPLVTYLSHYMLWCVLQWIPGDSFWVLEDDAEFIDDWRNQYSEAMSVLPDDWDVVFLGSCCAARMHKRHVGKNLYECRPMCGHAMMYRKKALPTLLRVHQKIWGPLDIAMMHESLPQLRVYSILPRIVNQRWSFIPA